MEFSNENTQEYKKLLNFIESYSKNDNFENMTLEEFINIVYYNKVIKSILNNFLLYFLDK